MESAERPTERPRATQEDQPKTVLQIMREDGIDIRESNQDIFSNVVKIEGFEGLSLQGQKCLVILAEEAKRFWTGLIIEDHFGTDQDKRYAYQNKMSNIPGYKEVDRRNKLSTGIQTNLYDGFKLLVRELDAAKIETPQSNKVREIYASLFPIESIGKSGELATDTQKKFPKLPRIDYYSQPYDAQWHVSEREPSYTAYYLDLSEEQRSQLLAEFDKAAHDFLELVTAPLEKKPNL